MNTQFDSIQINTKSLQSKVSVDQLSIKQQYFRTHIRSDDYDSFSEFCIKSKGNLDISSWTIEEVHDVSFGLFKLVRNFQFWKQYFQQKPYDSVDLVSVEKPHEPLPTKINDGFKESPKIDKKVVNVDSQIVHVSSRLQSTPEKKQSQSIVLSASEVMDLLTFTPPRQNYEKKPDIKVQSQNPMLSNVSKSEQRKQDNKLTQNNPNSLKNIPFLEIIKLEPISDQPLHSQKRYSQPSLSSSQIVSKTSLNVPKIYKEEFEETIKCKTPQKFSFQNIKSVSIKKHEIVHKAFFLPDYVMYQVELQPLNIVCKRNYDDFKRLHDTLVKFYPGSKLPYLESNSWLSETNIEFIKKQKICLEYFLNELVRNETFRDSFALYQFLTVTDHKSIKRKFQQYDEISIPKSIENLESPAGSMKIKLLNTDNHFIQKASSFSQEITQFLNQYNDLTLSAISNYDSLISNMSAISKLINSFKKKTEDFKEFEHKLNISLESQLKQLPESLKVWEQLIGSELKNLCSKKEILFEKVLQYTTYQHANIQSMDQLLYKRTQIQQNYLYQVENQPTSPSTAESKPKPKDYLSPQLLPHKIGLLQVSQNLIVSKYHLAFLNTKVKQELILQFQYLGRGLKELFHQRLQQFVEKDKNQLHETICHLIEKTKI